MHHALFVGNNDFFSQFNIFTFRRTGESTEKILPLLTENPATMLGLQNSIGFIGEGKDADVLIMDSEFQIKETFVKGRRII